MTVPEKHEAATLVSEVLAAPVRIPGFTAPCEPATFDAGSEMIQQPGFGVEDRLMLRAD